MLDSLITVFLTSTYSHSSTSSIGFSFFFRCFWASSWSSVKRIHHHLSNQNTNPPLNPSVTPVMLPYKMADGYWAALLPAHEWAGNRLSPEQRWPSLQTLPLQKSVDSTDHSILKPTHFKMRVLYPWSPFHIRRGMVVNFNKVIFFL